MAFHVTTQYGLMESDVSDDRMIELLTNIAPDDEHPDLSMTHESGWCIGVFSSGLVVSENLEGDVPRHMRLERPVDALPFWRRLARGDIAYLETRPWLPGYGNDADR